MFRPCKESRRHPADRESRIAYHRKRGIQASYSCRFREMARRIDRALDRRACLRFHYMFASLTAHVTALLPVMVVVGAAVPGLSTTNTRCCCA